MKSLTSYSDEQLFQWVKQGNREAFECIYRKHWPRLFDAAYRRVKSKEAAEEVIQELFTYLWCKREEIELTHAFSTYIHVALKYRVFNFIRKEINKQKYVEAIQGSREYDNNPVEESLLYNELSRAIDKEIDDLPERCRQVFTLSRKENLTFKEIAERLGISINTVEKHMGKALRIMRTNLKDYVRFAAPTFLIVKNSYEENVLGLMNNFLELYLDVFV